MYDAAPINAFFKAKLHVDHEEAVVEIDIRPDFHHAAGAMHGAVYFKALDDATFFAANSIVEDVFVLTAHFEIDLLRPIREGSIRAIARVTDRNDKRILASGELFDEHGALIARGCGEFAVSKIPLCPETHYC